MIKIQTSHQYDRSLKKIFKSHPYLKQEVRVCIKLFRKNPDDTRLRNHPLRKRMEGKHAFSIDGDTRIIYEWMGKRSVRLLNIGTHQQVYRLKK